MLKIASNITPMERALKQQLINHGIHILFNSKKASSRHYLLEPPFVKASSISVNGNLNSAVYPNIPKVSNQKKHGVKTYAGRRRRAYAQSDTYVVLEPGKTEEFVSEDELRVKLRERLENWPGKSLPQDLAKFEDLDDAVSYLIKSVCELQIDGDVGSIQWYQVRME